VTNPATSSPGLAFLIATVGAKGEDGYLDYWAALRDNGVKVAASWSDAYSVDFSGSSGQGSYPLVVSYVTSPLSEEATSNLDKTCFRQVEYAAVVAGTGHEAEAGQYIDFLLSEGFQSQIPDTMWMYPVNPAATLPAGWAEAAAAIEPVQVSAADIGAHREEWIERWTETVL
jgi:thiamine transport system substrate-binding protein